MAAAEDIFIIEVFEMASEPPGLLPRCFFFFERRFPVTHSLDTAEDAFGVGDTVRWGGDPQAQKCADDHHKRMEDG